MVFIFVIRNFCLKLNIKNHYLFLEKQKFNLRKTDEEQLKNTTPSLDKLLVFYEGLFGKPKYVVSCRLIRTQKIPREVVVLEVRNYKFFLEV